jgi:CRISPR system Cascade subunit CasB
MITEQRRWLKFTDPGSSMILLDWWENLEMNRGDRADLRRCKVPEDVIFVPSYHQLRKALSQFAEINDRSLCIVTGVLSHVRANDQSEPFAAQLARIPAGKDTPVMSELRFRKFLSIRDPVILFREGIRAVRMVDGIANIPDLAHGLYWWTQETRKEWAFTYYEKIV